MKLGADFDALIARFSPNTDHPLAIAVSGGSDSLALLSLTDAWATDHQRALIVFTVDHQLRPEAKSEADAVARLASELGHKHQTLVWDDPKATQSAARKARYRLMCAAMHDHGAACPLLGHTLDDVVETALIRRRRGVRDASIAGPALASPAPVWPEGRGVSLVRPLIRVSREALQAHLQQRNWSWADDPSNHSTAFERVKIRQFLDRHPRLKSQSTRFVRALQDQRHLDDIALARALERVRVHPDGLIEIDDPDASLRTLSLLCRCASGTASEPRGSAMRELFSRLDAPGTRQTLGGAWIQKTANGFLIGRDPGISPKASSDSVFDGRFLRSKGAGLPEPCNQGFLVRHGSPPSSDWREIVSERIKHIARCYQTPHLEPVAAP